MKKQIPIFLVATIVLLISGFQQIKAGGPDEWEHPLKKMGYLNTPMVEVEPLVINGEFYLLENWRSGWDWPGQPSESAGKNNEMWIAHLPNGPEDYEGRKYLSAALKGNTLGSAIVWKDRVYVFGVNEASGRQFVEMTWSEDIKNWSLPVKVFDSPAGDIFNVSLARDDNGFVFQWETNGIGRPFTMCFGRIKNLTDNWNDHVIENACYGKDKYTGGPAVIYEAGWYYLLYAERLPDGWETRIARSRDLINWEDAPEDRPFVTFDPGHKNIPLHSPEVHEINATDPSLTYYKGEVIVYFTGGIQRKGGDLQWAKFEGTVKELMESFFE
jgi:alpha-L-fucosidase